VGWYLMIPSEVIVPGPHEGYAGMVAPISNEWKVVHRYKTADECADGLRFFLSHFDAVSKFADQIHQNAGNVQEQLIYGGACFRDDDPRLKQDRPSP